ncbi:MAG: twin-arginine translocation pathway signal protein, partial [Diaphorobacter nitroreducens]
MQRRALLKAVGAACAIGAAAYAPVARAQEQRALAVTQIVDLSPQNQDVSRDFLIGSRAAWTDLNARGGGIRGRSVQQVVVETD